MGCHPGESVVGGPRRKRVLILYSNCTVIERDADESRVSWKLTQLDAAEEGLGTRMPPLGDAAPEAVDRPRKVF